MDLDSIGNVTQTVFESGLILTFGDSLFTWEQMYVPTGDNLVGFFVSDLDGNLIETFTQITV